MPTSIPGRARTRRIVLILIIAVAVEAALYALAKRAPALASLIFPVYFIVMLIAAYSIMHALWRRARNERRHDDRRGPGGASTDDVPGDPHGG